jgi:outer membrane protein OmpA-like peptidoglycan-associated protein
MTLDVLSVLRNRRGSQIAATVFIGILRASFITATTGGVMHNLTRRVSLAVLLVVGVIAVSGCATRQYVTHQVATVERQIAEVRDADAERAERIDAVDRRALEGLSAANRAEMAAENAHDRAAAAGRMAADADRRANAAQQNAQRALNRIDIVENQLENRIVNLDKYTVVDHTTVTFKFDSYVLTNEAMSKLDDIAGQVSSSGYVMEIQGFTDSIGSENYNLELSERRAESVLRYLVGKNVPLYRISILGLGQANPIADNKTTEGRDQNRRVEIRVLEPGRAVATAQQ